MRYDMCNVVNKAVCARIGANNTYCNFKSFIFPLFDHLLPYGLVVRIRRSHRRGPGSIPGVGKTIFFSLFLFFSFSFFVLFGSLFYSDLSFCGFTSKNSKREARKLWQSILDVTADSYVVIYNAMRMTFYV